MSHNYFHRIKYVGIENTTALYGYEVERKKRLYTYGTMGNCIVYIWKMEI